MPALPARQWPLRLPSPRAIDLLLWEGFNLPYALALQRYVCEYKVEWGKFAAGALIVSAPMMALFFALQKHLVGGLTAGGVKG